MASTPNSRKWRAHDVLAKRALRNFAWEALNGIATERENQAFNRRKLMRGEIDVETYWFRLDATREWISWYQMRLNIATKRLAAIRLGGE